MWGFLCQKKSNLLKIEDTCLLFTYLIYNFDWFMKKKESQLEHSISKCCKIYEICQKYCGKLSNFQGDFFCMASFKSLELWAWISSMNLIIFFCKQSLTKDGFRYKLSYLDFIMSKDPKSLWFYILIENSVRNISPFFWHNKIQKERVSTESMNYLIRSRL